MSDTAPDPWDNEPEIVWAANENTEIKPGRMSKALLDPDLDDGAAAHGWYQVDDTEAVRLQAEADAAVAAPEPAAEPEPAAPESEPAAPEAEPDAASWAPGK